MCPFAAGRIGSPGYALQCQYTGASSGTLEMNIDPSGSLSVATPTTSTTNPVYGNGSVSYLGTINFTIVLGASPGSTTFTGTMQKSGSTITGSGAWSGSDGTSGTWTVS